MARQCLQRKLATKRSEVCLPWRMDCKKRWSPQNNPSVSFADSSLCTREPFCLCVKLLYSTAISVIALSFHNQQIPPWNGFSLKPSSERKVSPQCLRSKLATERSGVCRWRKEPAGRMKFALSVSLRVLLPPLRGPPPSRREALAVCFSSCGEPSPTKFQKISAFLFYNWHSKTFMV